ncbi:hypothetical protein GWI33_013576 [Rhynchophorus ferrugineus]|uniref:CRAL-TRIO domain-containing protein n=1 Tax=Rhynchophorus ferrugineus TaxID=354439 RepID=A0A834I9C2_RHYFE|nr:hypothetical protein GWI33_013576 [Rhynchophorus ferrugineus]
MSATSKLSNKNRDDIKKLVLAKLDQTEDALNQEVEGLKTWLRKQRNVPEIPPDAVIENFVILNKFNVKKVKDKLKMYYQIRWDIPEFYVNKNPKLTHMKSIAETVCWVPLPELTPQANRVIMMKFLNADPSIFNIWDFIAYSYNIAEVRLREDVATSDVFIYDFDGITFSHYMKISPDCLRKASIVLERVYSSRVAGIHYLNLPTSLEVLIKFVKVMLKEKLRKRICIHKTVETLYEHVPKESLPEEYGGKGLSLLVLHGLWLKKMEEYQDVFDHLEQIAINGKPNKPIDAETEAPVRHFNQLAID